ncbi:MAG TPA: hypothetical protein VGK67_33745 [Myxococcales bacterium]|jgi:hypothetical protein
MPRRSRPGPSLAVAVIAAIGVAAAAGCQSKAKEDLATFSKAEARHRDAKRLVAEGKVEQAGEAYLEAQRLLLELRRRAGRTLEGEEPLAGEVVAGFTPRQWQERWKQDFKDTLKLEFGTLQSLAAQGTLERTVARDFLDRYAPDLAERWAGKKEEPRSGPELYHFECTATEEQTCGVLFEVVTRRLARPTTTDRLPPAARAAAWGLVEVRSLARSWAGADAPTAGAAGGSGGGSGGGSAMTVFSLPRSLEVTIKVSTRSGRSSWDGEKHLSVLADPPTKVEASEMAATFRRQLSILREKMVKEIDALPRQTFEP